MCLAHGNDYISIFAGMDNLVETEKVLLFKLAIGEDCELDFS